MGHFNFSFHYLRGLVELAEEVVERLDELADAAGARFNGKCSA